MVLQALLLAAAVDTTAAPSIVNPAIDMEGHLRNSAQAAEHCERRRVSEGEVHPHEPRARHHRARRAQP